MLCWTVNSYRHYHLFCFVLVENWFPFVSNSEHKSMDFTFYLRTYSALSHFYCPSVSFDIIILFSVLYATNLFSVLILILKSSHMKNIHIWPRLRMCKTTNGNKEKVKIVLLEMQQHERLCQFSTKWKLMLLKCLKINTQALAVSFHISNSIQTF